MVVNRITPFELIELSAFRADSLFPDKPPVNAGDACSTVDKGCCFNGFHRVQGNDELYWNLHSG